MTCGLGNLIIINPMTHFKTEIEEIEKRFENSFWYQDIGDGSFFKDCHLERQIKAFFFKEILPSLLSKFAAEINGEEITQSFSSFSKAAWNAHHRSVAEKAEEIIKELQ